MTTVAPKRRGRPRKTNIEDTKVREQLISRIEPTRGNVIVNFQMPLDEINTMTKETGQETKQLKKSQTESHTKTKTLTQKTTTQNDEDFNGTLDFSDVDDEVHDEKELLQELHEKNKLIRELKDKLLNYETENVKFSPNSIKLTPMKLNLVHTQDNTYVVSKTKIACYYCCHQFDTTPWFLPESYYDNVYHVYGCFCSPNCAMAYNIELRDSKVSERYTLLKNMIAQIIGKTKQSKHNIISVKPSPSRHVLKLFGGPMTIEEYRKNLDDYEKEYRIVTPPMSPIVSLVEIKEKTQICEFGTFKMENRKNNIIDTLGITMRTLNFK